MFYLKHYIGYAISLFITVAMGYMSDLIDFSGKTEAAYIINRIIFGFFCLAIYTLVIIIVAAVRDSCGYEV